jgi:cell division protein FtsB
VSSISISQNTPATPLENHKECLATMEALERENRALMRDKDALSEHIHKLEGENQKLLNH